MVSVADGQIEPLTALAWNRVDSTVWLPDWSGLIMVAKEKGAWDSIQLWHISYPGGAARRILSDLDNYGSGIRFVVRRSVVVGNAGAKNN